jgi:2-keto-4-pentenoate hydratase/2-oxohepta-3-ene-1,7-dioic acid hydratase in catechol pathway
MRIGNIDGRAVLVEDGRWIDIEAASEGLLPADPMAVIARLGEVAGLRVPAGAPKLDEARLGPPVPRPQKILGAGINYHGHADEAGFEKPEEPVFFSKLPSALCGPRDEIVIPSGRTTVDWEAELVVVIGRRGRDISLDDVWSYVAGFTCGQDISDRDEQFRSLGQFTMGKSFDTYAPLGPVLVTLDEFRDPADVWIRCRLDGEVVQNGHTRDWIFGVPELITWASRVCTLEAGDLIFTGTPSGVGYIQDPPRFLSPGSLLETSIDGVGVLRNRCVAADSRRLSPAAVPAAG